MKTVNLHNGVHHCPECCIEYELFSEASLKCEECGGVLVEGSLEDESEDEPEGCDEAGEA